MTEEWTHAFTLVCDADCKATNAILIHGSPEHPEALLTRHARAGAALPVVQVGLVCFSCQRWSLLRYLRSWDHEPSQAEMEAEGFVNEDWVLEWRPDEDADDG
jgi:hypothetical protein